MLKDRIFVLETKRQAVHLFLGLTISVAVYHLMPIVGYYILVPLMVALIVLLQMQKRCPNLRIANHLVCHFERDNDAINCPFKGSIFYGFGIIPPILFLPLNYACAVIAVLSVGDSTSTWIGKFFGRIRIGHKSLEGTLTFFIFSSLAVLLYVQDYQIALIFGLVGAILELFTLIDDNLFIPLGLTILYHLLNIITPNLIV